MKVLGIDLSLNHAGMVALSDAIGSEAGLWWECVVDKVGEAKVLKERGRLLKMAKSPDRQQVQMDRLQWWQVYLPDLMERVKPTHVVIEDYALRAQSNSAYQIGELGGVARLIALQAGALLRLHDPVSVKMYLAHDGTATPDDTAEAVMKEWDAAASFAKLPKAAMLDLCPAFGLAAMGWAELLLRAGKLPMSSFHPKEIQVFQRTTRAYPVSLLGREWLVRTEFAP